MFSETGSEARRILDSPNTRPFFDEMVKSTDSVIGTSRFYNRLPDATIDPVATYEAREVYGRKLSVDHLPDTAGRVLYHLAVTQGAVLVWHIPELRSQPDQARFVDRVRQEKEAYFLRVTQAEMNDKGRVVIQPPSGVVEVYPTLKRHALRIFRGYEKYLAAPEDDGMTPADIELDLAGLSWKSFLIVRNDPEASKRLLNPKRSRTARPSIKSTNGQIVFPG